MANVAKSREVGLPECGIFGPGHLSWESAVSALDHFVSC